MTAVGNRQSAVGVAEIAALMAAFDRAGVPSFGRLFSGTAAQCRLLREHFPDVEVHIVGRLPTADCRLPNTLRSPARA